ncbi:MAG: MBL fold metallo-hydrolase [Bacteroidetes bacterium]|nr:MBL fold metallo-hydrolase [Bacteroidota bacterium]
MLTVKFFTFNPVAENTYVLHDETKECVLIDVGCHSEQEKAILRDYIAEKKLKPVMLLCTHTHFDHIMGNQFVLDTYGLKPIVHKEELFILQSQEAVAQKYGIAFEHSPMPEQFIAEGDVLKFGNTSLHVLHTPGHSPGHVAFYNAENHLLINGDVLFKGTIGRTDIPLGNFADLERSIKTKLYTLPEQTTVYCGHGPVTNIGYEKTHNMFVNAD